MDVDAIIVVDVLVQQIAELTKENAILKAQITTLQQPKEKEE